MANKGEPTYWPMLLDLTRGECKKILRRLELLAYNGVVQVLRAQGAFTPEKKRLLQDLANMLDIPVERHKAEVRLAVNCERLATIAEHMSGPNTDLEWRKEGRRIAPVIPRQVLLTADIERANAISRMVAAMNSKLPQPAETARKNEVKQEIGSINGGFRSSYNNMSSTSTVTSSTNVSSQPPTSSVINPNNPKHLSSSTTRKRLIPLPVFIGPPSSTNTSAVLPVPPLLQSFPTFKVPAVPPYTSSESDISAIAVASPVTNAASTPSQYSITSTLNDPSTLVTSVPAASTIPSVSSTSNFVAPTSSLPSIRITTLTVPLPVSSNKSPTSDASLSPTIHPLKTSTLSVIPSSASIVQPVNSHFQISTSTSNISPADTSTLIVVPPSSTLSNSSSLSSDPPLLSFSIDDSPSSTSIDSTVNSVLTTISECPPEITPLASTESTISALKQSPVSNAIVSISTDLSSISTSSFLSSIPLIEIPPSTALSSASSVENSAAVPITSVNEIVDLEKPSSTALLTGVEEKSQKLQDKVEDFNAVGIPAPTLVLPSGMSIQLHEGDIDEPKKRKRSLSQDASMTAYKKIMTVPVTKITSPLNSRAMSTQGPVKISVTTPTITKTSSTTSSTSSQKVIIMSNTSSAAYTPNGVLQKSLGTVKTNHRFHNPLLTDVDTTVKCLAVPNVSGTTRILPNPSSMLIVNPTTQKASVNSSNASHANSNGQPEVKPIQSSAIQAGKPGIVIVHNGPVSKELKITNASKDLVNKVLTSKPVPVQSKLPPPNKQQTASPPMTAAGTSGNFIVLDLSLDQYNHNSTLAEILQTPGILPTSLSLPGTSESQQVLSPEVEPGVQASGWMEVDDYKSSQDASIIQEEIKDNVLDFLEEDSTANHILETEENVEPVFGQSELDLEEQQVFSITTDISENDIAFIAGDKPFDSQSTSNHIIIEPDSDQVSDEQHPQIRSLSLMNAPVTIQQSDLDASSILLEEYTSQQIENQTLT